MYLSGLVSHLLSVDPSPSPMRSSHMAVQFTRRDPGRDSLADDTFQPPLPQRILDRHGARVLNPSTAVIAAGWAPPRPTVYRSASLLVPEDVLRDGELLNVTNRVLAEAG